MHRRTTVKSVAIACWIVREVFMGRSPRLGVFQTLGYSEEDKPKTGVESFKIERFPGDRRTIPTGGPSSPGRACGLV
jgi:hypothetical protein